MGRTVVGPGGIGGIGGSGIGAFGAILEQGKGSIEAVLATPFRTDISTRPRTDLLPDGYENSLGGVLGTDYTINAVNVNRTGAANQPGADSNISVFTSNTVPGSPAGTVEWFPGLRQLFIYVGATGTALGGTNWSWDVNGIATEGTLKQAVAASGAPLQIDDSGTNVALLIYPGQTINWTGGADAEDVLPDATRGLFVYTDETTPQWQLKAVERQIAEAAVRSELTYVGSDDDSALRVIFGNPDRPERDVQRNSLPPIRYAQPEDVDDWTIRHVQVAEWRGVKARYSPRDGGPIFEAVSAGVAGNNIVVEAQAGQAGATRKDAYTAGGNLPDQGGAAVLQGLRSDDSFSSSRNSLQIYPPYAGAESNGVEIRTLPLTMETVTAVRATGSGSPNSNVTLTLTAKVAGTDTNGWDLLLGENSSIGGAGSTSININDSLKRVQLLFSQRVSANAIAAALNNNSNVPFTATASGSDAGTELGASGAGNWLSINGFTGTITLSGGVDAVSGDIKAFDVAFMGSDSNLANNRNNKILLQAANAGSGGDGFVVAFSGTDTGQDRISASYTSATRLAVVMKGAATNQQIVNAINAARRQGSQLIEASLAEGASGSVQHTFSASNQPHTRSTTLGRNGKILWKHTSEVLELYTDGTITAVAFRDTIRGSDYPLLAGTDDDADYYTPSVNTDGRADLINSDVDAENNPAAGNTSADRIPSGVTLVFANGVNSRSRTPLGFNTSAGGGTTTYTLIGVLAGDTIADLRNAVSSIFGGSPLIAIANPAAEDSDAIALTIPSTPGNRIFRGQLAGGLDASPRPNPDITSFTSGDGRVRYEVSYIGDNFPEDTRTTLAEFDSEWRSHLPVQFVTGDDFDYVVNGDQSLVATTLPTQFNSGKNYVPPSPVEFIVHDENAVDARTVEVRYHEDFDTLENIYQNSQIDSFNPDGVKVYVISGTQLEAFPPEPPFEKPMVPSGTSAELADEIHEFAWAGSTTPVSDTDLEYLEHDYLIFEGWMGSSATEMDHFTTSIRRSLIPASGANTHIGTFSASGTDRAASAAVTLDADGQLTINPQGSRSNNGEIRVWGSTSPSGIGRGPQGTPGRNVNTGGGLSTVQTDDTLTGDGSSSDPLKVANPFTAADETKLDGIEAGAEVNVQPDWDATAGDAFINNKPTIPTVPDKASNSDVDGETDDTDYTTVAKVFRAIGRKVRDASKTARGIIEIASNSELDTGTDDERAVTPLGVNRMVERLVPSWARQANAPSSGDTTVTKLFTDVVLLTGDRTLTSADVNKLFYSELAVNLAVTLPDTSNSSDDDILGFVSDGSGNITVAGQTIAPGQSLAFIYISGSGWVVFADAGRGGGDDNVQPDWDQTDDTADDYIENKPDIPEVIDGLNLTLAGTTLTLTAEQTGSASDIVGTLDVSSLEEYRGEWNTLSGQTIRVGDIISHSNRYFISRTEHTRQNNGPDTDSTRFALLTNWGGAYDAEGYYHSGTIVLYNSLLWANDSDVLNSDPDPDATANTKWHRLSPLTATEILAAVPAASTTTAGLIEIATNTEGDTGTDGGRAMTPAGVRRQTGAQVSAAERAATTPETSVRRFSPADIVAMIGNHAATGGLSTSEVLALFSTWARVADTSRIPANRLDTDVVLSAELTTAIANFRTETQINALITTALDGLDALTNAGVYANGTAYEAGAVVRHGGNGTQATYLCIQDIGANIAASEPGVGADWRTSWYRIGFEDGPPNAFTGATRSGNSIIFSRESGQNPVTVSAQVEAGELVHRVVGSANYDFSNTNRNTYVSENTNETPISRGDIVDGDLLGITIGAVTNTPNTLVLFPASVIADSAAAGDTGDAANTVHIEDISFTGIPIALAWDSDGHLLVAGDVTKSPTPLTLYRFSKNADTGVGNVISSQLGRIQLAADHVEGTWLGTGASLPDPFVDTDVFHFFFDDASSNAYSKFFNGAELNFLFSQNYVAGAAVPSDNTGQIAFTLAGVDFHIGRSASGEILLRSVDDDIYEDSVFELDILRAPRGPIGQGWGPPTELGTTTFDLDGSATNVPLVGTDGNALVCPQGGDINAVISIPTLGLVGSSVWVLADDLREAVANAALTASLYTNDDNEIIFRAGAQSGASTANEILIRHIPGADEQTDSGQSILPSIARFDLTGDLSPNVGSIAGDRYGYDLAISQSGHAGSARIVGFAGTSANPSAVTVLAEVTDLHSESGTITIPPGVTLASARDVYTVRLEVYTPSQTPATDQPRIYHDARIVAHAVAATVHFGYILSDEDATDVDFSTDDITSRGAVAGDWTVTGLPQGDDEYRIYWAVPTSLTQPGNWVTSGFNVNSSIDPAVERTIDGTAYNFYLSVADSPFDSTGNGITYTVS